MNKINKINVGVIGLGVGEAHINSYQSIPEVEVLSICDLNKSRLKEIGDKYNIPNRYDCSKKITEDAKIDLVSICSYDNFHASQVISAFRNGKHVMVEKPFVLFKHEAEEVILE